MKKVIIGNREISNDSSAFIIAEMSANHKQNFEIAKETIKAAKRAGADAIKLQTFTPDTMTLNCKSDLFKLDKDSLWSDMYLYDLYKEAYTPWEWHKGLMEIAKENNLICFSTPFDKTSIDFLEKLDVPAYKIASFEITDIPLIKYAASTQKPVIISTGIGTIEEIQEAVSACKSVGNEQVVLLKCTSSYPAPLEEINLKTIPNLAETFDVLSGLSDHTKGINIPIGAVALGAKVIEKHFVLNNRINTLDSEFSLSSVEFKEMVEAVRDIEKALGKVNYSLSEKSLKSRELCRSLFISSDVKKGDVVTEKNVKSVRPGQGLAPKYFETIIGKTFKDDFKMGTPVKLEYINL